MFAWRPHGRVDPAVGAVTVDVIQFLTDGDAAARAAGEDGAEVPPPNDYYIRNTSSRLRILRVASGAPITVNVHDTGVRQRHQEHPHDPR